MAVDQFVNINCPANREHDKQSRRSKAVVFECVRTTFPAPAPATPDLTYTYRTDQELVQVSQTAGAYCLRYGWQPMTSRMVTNPNGSRTVTFQCGLR